MPDAEPWASEPLRQKRLLECFEVDIAEVHLNDLCHKAEEPAVRQTLWELYETLYETYAIFAGRSQWPLVRQVDVYSLFEEARLLNRNGPGAPSEADAPPEPASSEPLPLTLQSVQQMLVQTIAYRRQSASRGASKATGQGVGVGVGGGALPVDEKMRALAKRAAAIEQRTKEGLPLSRVQFIEVMLRAALALRASQPAALAFRSFADKILVGRIMQPPLSKFPRGLAVQVGAVCDTLLARRKTIREAWERFGSSENAFQRLAQCLKLCDRSFTAKHVASIYALSRRPQVTCASNTGVLIGGGGLAYDEFCEAIARLAMIWRHGSRVGLFLPGDNPPWPPQPQVGRPVRQKAVAARLEAFLAKLQERMKPARVYSSPSF